MFAPHRNASHAYRQVAVESGISSASPHALVLMLLDGALAAVADARVKLVLAQRASKCEAITKAIDIVDQGLKASLNLTKGGELALRLASLYDYIVRRLVEANAHDDAKALEEVGRLLSELRGAWAQIEQAVTA